MATERVNFDVTQDAVLIFVNDSLSMNEEEAGNLLEQIFHGAKEYLYLDGASIQSGGMLVNKIAQERNMYQISIPTSNRLVVCFWLDLVQLTDEWFGRYQNIVESIQKFLPVQGYGQHNFITCFTYEVGTSLIDKASIEILKHFADSNMAFSHMQYLLYKPMLGKLDQQKTAMLQLLHMWTRADYQRILDPSDLMNMKSLRIVNCADYQEKAAEECQNKIRLLEEWLSQNADPQLEKFLRTVLAEAEKQSAKLDRALDHFDELSYLYPVRITDYHKPLIGKAERLVDSGPGSMLEKRKLDYICETENELLAGSDFTYIVEQIKNELHYPDLDELRKKMELGIMKRDFQERMKKPDKSIENSVEMFLNEWYKLFEDTIISALPDEHKERTKKQMEINRQKERLKEAGKYQNLEDCLARISGQISFPIPSVVLPKGNNLFMLIAGECNTNWLVNGYSVGGVNQVYSYSNISPAEVMMMREAPLIELEDDNATDELSWILQ